MTVLPGQDGVAACAADLLPTCDEGTAMLEIIHDLAPKADLYFATAFTSAESFAQNIRDLRTAGCDIILDDVFYLAESPFQDGQASTVISPLDEGVITQAVNEVVADGALYFSSAGNNGNKDDSTSQTYEGDFVSGGSNSQLPGGTVQKFGTTSPTNYDTVSATVTGGGLVALYWADPLGGSSNDYGLYVLDSTGTLVDGVDSPQTGTQDPAEGLVQVFRGDRVVVFKANGAADRFFHLAGYGARFNISTNGAMIGHPGATGAYAVAATPAVGPYPNPFGGGNVIETFSSDGPRRIFFEADGTPITPGNFSSTGGSKLPKPDITAADGVSVTGVGGFGSPFFGTSAAAPHAGGIAALVMSSNLNLTNAEIGSVLTSTAVDIMFPNVDVDSGQGIVMAFDAVEQTAPDIANLEPNSGDEGTVVVISGRRFGAAGTVTFAGTPATPTSWADNSITVPVPTGATTGNVVVVVSNNITSNGVIFTLTPSITGLSVSKAPAGTAVTVTGTHFGATQGTNTVKFNGTTANVTAWSDTSIATTVPPAASSGNVVVTINGIASNQFGPFTVEDFANPASLADITVKAGASGSDPFTITTTTGFDAAITFSCTGLPSKATCSFNPASVPSMASSADVTMTVSTTAPTTNGVSSGLFGIWLPFGGLGLVLATGAGARHRSRKGLRAMAAMLLLLFIAAIVSCGGSNGPQTVPGTPPGSYTVTMKATATGGTTHSTTFKLNVNP